jgi:hypothetical protein
MERQMEYTFGSVGEGAHSLYFSNAKIQIIIKKPISHHTVWLFFYNFAPIFKQQHPAGGIE